MVPAGLHSTSTTKEQQDWSPRAARTDQRALNVVPGRDSRSPTSTIAFFSLSWAPITTDCHKSDGVHRSLVAALHGLFFCVQENNENLQITNFAGLRRVICAGKTLEHRELQLICVTWQRLSGSVKYLNVYFSKCGNIFIAWPGSSERMQIRKHAYVHVHARTANPCPYFLCVTFLPLVKMTSCITYTRCTSVFPATHF